MAGGRQRCLRVSGRGLGSPARKLWKRAGLWRTHLPRCNERGSHFQPPCFLGPGDIATSPWVCRWLSAELRGLLGVWSRSSDLIPGRSAGIPFPFCTDQAVLTWGTGCGFSVRIRRKTVVQQEGYGEQTGIPPGTCQPWGGSQQSHKQSIPGTAVAASISMESCS